MKPKTIRRFLAFARNRHKVRSLCCGAEVTNWPFSRCKACGSGTNIISNNNLKRLLGYALGQQRSKPDMESIKLGQIYKDNDPRVDRRIRVIGIERFDADGKPTVDPPVHVINIETSRMTFVRASRLLRTNHRGFTFEGMSK